MTEKGAKEQVLAMERLPNPGKTGPHDRILSAYDEIQQSR